MKKIEEWLGVIAIILVLGFVFVWAFVPEKKQDIQDWWYSVTLDCDQMQRAVINDQQCKTSNECELSGKELIEADKLAAQYVRYCGAI